MPMSDKEKNTAHMFAVPAILPDGNGDSTAFPEFITVQEFIVFLSTSQLSSRQKYQTVTDNLTWMCGLARIHICTEPLHPRRAIVEPCSK
jgi:hypothetical protein